MYSLDVTNSNALPFNPYDSYLDSFSQRRLSSLNPSVDNKDPFGQCIIFFTNMLQKGVDLSIPTNTIECKESNNNNTSTASLVFRSISITQLLKLLLYMLHTQYWLVIRLMFMNLNLP
jgi:hypothetical protein